MRYAVIVLTLLSLLLNSALAASQCGLKSCCETQESLPQTDESPANEACRDVKQTTEPKDDPHKAPDADFPKCSCCHFAPVTSVIPEPPASLFGKAPPASLVQIDSLSYVSFSTIPAIPPP
jgi:hypothetical protein